MGHLNTSQLARDKNGKKTNRRDRPWASCVSTDDEREEGRERESACACLCSFVFFRFGRTNIT